MNKGQTWTKDGYVLRFAQSQEAEDYYEQNFRIPDPETARLTGSKDHYEKKEVTSFFERAALDPDRIFLLLISPEGKIIGETMVNEQDLKTKTANFRMVIFDEGCRGHGLGSWMCEITRDLAFEKLGLNTLTLDVFSFNPAARKVYEKAGFRITGMEKGTIPDGDGTGDDIFMNITRDEWLKLKDPHMAESGN